MIKDGNGAYYDATAAKFITTPFGKTLPQGGTTVADLEDTTPFTPFNYGDAATFAKKVDNSVAGEMRDCGECHVGGGMMEYIIDPIKTAAAEALEAGTGAVYNPGNRTSLRDYAFGGAYTAYNALIDIFNPAKDLDGKYTNRGDVITHNYAETGVLEMDCLICHQSGYSWSKRKEAVREGHFDASRALGANLATSAVNGVTVFYNSTSVSVNDDGNLTVDLSAKLNAKPASAQCNSCHQGSAETKYQVEWKKRGEMWTYLDENGNKVDGDVHASIGCMACHERKDKSASSIGTSGLPGTPADAKLSLCDPAKGGPSPFEALWNQLDNKGFKNCNGCHEPASVAGKTEDPLTYSGDSPYLTYETYGAPGSTAAHTRLGLNTKIAYDKDGALVSHIDLIDCTACHIKKDGFTGGAFVDGTGADEEGRVALHDTENVARDMKDAAGLNWLGGRLHSSMYLTSFFWRDMNGLKADNGGLDANNDGREAGMDPLLPTHVNNINIANGVHALTEDPEGITAAKISARQALLTSETTGIKSLLGNATPNSTHNIIPKLSFLLVPFKTAHNIAGADKAWGVKGCKECHSAAGTVIAAADADNRTGEEYTGGGFYNGTYPINGNMEGKFSFNSNQVATYTKVNGLADPTDSHPNVVTKKGDRSVPVKVLSMFDNPYATTVTPGQTLRNIDRSEVLYEATFQTRNTEWIGTAGITGGVLTPGCDPASPFYCAAPAAAPSKKGATSTLGWTLKVEIKNDTTQAVTTRTKQVGNDMVANVNELITALGGPFTNNDDFTVAAVIAGGGTTSNAIKLTPKSGRTIRLSDKSDVGPFGLKGKLWKDEAIVRPSGSYVGRAAWLTYLNSISKENLGNAVAAPVAAIANISGTAANGGTTLVEVQKNDPIEPNQSVTATTGMTYKWRINTSTFEEAKEIAFLAREDEDDHSLDQAPLTASTANAWIDNSTIATPVIKFNKTGIWRITLAVTNIDGKISVTNQRVNVTVPALITSGTISSTIYTGLGTLSGITTTRTTITTTVPVALGGGKSFSKVKLVWGDGSTSTVYSKSLDGLTTNTDPVPDQTHVYKLFNKYKTGTVYKYTTTIQFWDRTKLIATESFTVSIDTAAAMDETSYNPYPIVVDP